MRGHEEGNPKRKGNALIWPGIGVLGMAIILFFVACSGKKKEKDEGGLQGVLQKGVLVTGAVQSSIYKLYGVADRRQWHIQLNLKNDTKCGIDFGEDMILVESDATAASLNGVYHSRSRPRTGPEGMVSQHPWAMQYNLGNFELVWADGTSQGYSDGGTYTFRDKENPIKDPEKISFGNLPAGQTRKIDLELLQGVWLKPIYRASLRVALPVFKVKCKNRTERFRCVVYFKKPADVEQPWDVAQSEIIPLQSKELLSLLTRPEENQAMRIFAANWLMEVDPQQAIGYIAGVAKSVNDGSLLFSCFQLLLGVENLADPGLAPHALELLKNSDIPNGIRSVAAQYLGHVKHEPAADALQGASKDKNEIVANAASEALAKLREKRDTKE